MSFNLKILAVVIVLLLAGLAVLIFTRSGEEAALVAVLEKGVTCVRAGDADGCIALIAKDYNHNGMNYDAVCTQVRTYVRPKRWDSVTATSVDPGVEGGMGQAKIKALLEQSGQKMPITLKVYFKKVDGAWVVSGYDVVEGRGLWP
jgi:hypothetical protein